MMRSILLTICLLFALLIKAGEIDHRAVVRSAVHNNWNTFLLSKVRLSSSCPFYKPMQRALAYLLGMDVKRMLNGRRRYADLLQKSSIYHSFSRPEGTRSSDLWHYLSSISLVSQMVQWQTKISYATRKGTQSAVYGQYLP